jgi:multimeric flavodoxin WrbA
MKILIISASPHKEKSQTLILAKEILKGCGDQAESEIIHLSDHSIGFCRHCEACHIRILKCPIKDDVNMILEKMLAADGIILASPNYINQVTAAMKALFDRSAHFIHCKRLLGKYIAGAVSSGSGRDKEVLDYIAYYGHTCGAQYAGGVSSVVPVGDGKKKEAFELGKALSSAIKAKKIFPDQIKTIEAAKAHFKTVMEKRKDEWLEEYQYWKAKGWL